MGKHAHSSFGSDSSSSSDSSGSESDHEDRSHKRQKKSHKKDVSEKDESHEKKRSHKKHSKDEKKDRKRKKEEKSSKKKKDRKKDSKSHKHKKDKKRKRSRSRSPSSSSSDSDSDSSARSRSPRHSSTTAAASSTPSITIPSASSITRCLGLIEKLLVHGGGERETSLREVQFLFFKLDAGSHVCIESIQDPLVKHILSSIFREMGLKQRQDPETQEEGWMSPVDKKGKVGYKLLDLLAAAFKKPEEKAPESTVVIGPAFPPTATTAASSASDSTSTSNSGPRVLGPAMPRPEDFDRLAAGGDEDLIRPDDDDDGGGGGFGPKMPSQMTPQELIAFDRLRESREQLASLKAAAKNGKVEGGRQDWMTMLPTASSSGMPSTTELANLIASGERDAMKGRQFQSKQAAVRHDQDDEWAMSPAERERKQQERLAIKQAEQAVYQSTLSIGGIEVQDFTGVGRSSANSSAAAAQAANDRMMARYKQQQSTTSDSLLAAHARAEAAAKKSAKSDSDGLFRWDHDTEMGMRAVKGAVALKKELTSAYMLNDNFAPAGNS